MWSITNITFTVGCQLDSNRKCNQRDWTSTYSK